MTLSNTTKQPISGSNVIEDGSATPVYRLNSDEVPSTTDDMEVLFSWTHGEILYGTHAKENEAMKNYINDINRAWGREKDYETNMIFIDTLTSKKTISDQLDALK